MNYKYKTYLYNAIIIYINNILNINYRCRNRYKYIVIIYFFSVDRYNYNKN